MRFQYTVKATITVTKWVELQTTLTKNILNEEENKSVLLAIFNFYIVTRL